MSLKIRSMWPLLIGSKSRHRIPNTLNILVSKINDMGCDGGSNAAESYSSKYCVSIVSTNHRHTLEVIIFSI